MTNFGRFFLFSREAQNEEQIAKLQQAHQEIMEAKAQYQEYIHQCDNGQPINVSAIDQLEIISNLSQQVSIIYSVRSVHIACSMSTQFTASVTGLVALTATKLEKISHVFLFDYE